MQRDSLHWPYIAAAAVCIGWLGAHSGLGKHFEATFQDAASRVLLHEIDSDIVIVSLDARSLARLSSWPWPRSHHADLIDKLAVASPRQLFVDIDFSTHSNPVDDARLAAALERWDAAPVVLPAFYQYATAGAEALLFSEPIPPLRAHATTASVNLRPAMDGLVRTVHAPPLRDGRALTAVAATLAGNASAGDVHIDYSIDPLSFRQISYSDVLDNLIPAQYFADKIVLVGATAIELGDVVAVPLHQALPGIVVHALAYESLRAGNHHPIPAFAYWLAVIGIAALAGWLFKRLSWRANTAIVALTMILTAAAAVFAYAQLALIFPVIPIALTLITCYFLSTLKSLEAQTLRAVMYAVGFRERDAMLKSIVMSSTDCIICIDETGIIRTANPAAVALLASGSSTLVGAAVLPFLPGLLSVQQSDGASSFAALPNAVTECTARTESGDEFPAELSISRVKLKDKRHHTVIVRDISERVAQQQQLKYQATHDPLTALPNRAALAAHVDSLLARSGEQAKAALLMIDLNRFKEVNDTLGHSVGDYVLFEVAQRFKNLTAQHGFIARIGGDEFALVVEHGDRAALTQLSQMLVASLNEPIQTSGIGIDLGLSLGIAVYPDDAGDAESLFKYADVAMYVAKRAGSGFDFYDSSNDQHTVRRLEIVSKLRTAIANSEVQLFYQPKINLATGRADSVEALMRWEDPTLGVVRPDEFVALAEPTDLIQPLSEWTLSRAFEQQRRWLQQGLSLRVAVNLSTRLLQDASLPGRVAQLMRQSGINADDVELEITESAMMLDPQRAMRIVHELSDLGVHIAIDDYGTGFSSLGYLRDLPVQSLKIDKSFVMNMRKHVDDRVIVESTMKMAHAMNMKVVAEGVEDQADVALLSEFGCDHAQGYFYSPALPGEALAAWVNAFHRRQATAREPMVARA